MKRTIQLITSVSPDLEIGLIVNRYSDKRVIDRSFTDFLAADDLPILGCVPTAEAFKRGQFARSPDIQVAAPSISITISAFSWAKRETPNTAGKQSITSNFFMRFRQIPKCLNTAPSCPAE